MVNKLVFLVLLMVIVVIGIFFGICIIEYNEFIFCKVWVCIGIFIIGSGVKDVIIFGRCVVFFVLVMMIFNFFLWVVWVYLNIFWGVWWVDRMVIFEGMLNFL